MQIQPTRSQLPSLIYAPRKQYDWESRERRKYESRSPSGTPPPPQVSSAGKPRITLMTRINGNEISLTTLKLEKDNRVVVDHWSFVSSRFFAKTPSATKIFATRDEFRR